MCSSFPSTFDEKKKENTSARTECEAMEVFSNRSSMTCKLQTHTCTYHKGKKLLDLGRLETVEQDLQDGQQHRLSNKHMYTQHNT